MTSIPDGDINLSQNPFGVQDTSAIEQHLQNAGEQIERLQKLASLGTMSAMLAHEFNNMLTPVMGYCRQALATGENDLMQRALDRTVKNVQQITAICAHITGMASETASSDEFRSIEVRDIVDEAIACLGRDLKRDNITLELNIPDDLTVGANAPSLQQVLFNLILNARQAMLSRRGTLTISARTDHQDLIIDVTDTGCGIPARNLARIFEPFFSTRSTTERTDQGGVGLGLHICRKLIRQMKGKITVISEPNVGTTFTITLPI